MSLRLDNLSSRLRRGATVDSKSDRELVPPVPRVPGRAPLARVPLWFAVPAIILYVALSLGPNLAGSFYAFTDWDGLSADANFVGFDNFQRIWDDPGLLGALKHTLLLAFGYMVLVNGLGMALAVGLNRQLKSRRFLRALFFAPAVVSPLAVAFVWQFIFQPDGPLNSALGSLGLSSLQSLWLVDSALWSVLGVMVWQHVGTFMIIYLAGLQTIPDELQEASALDGASVWNQFRHVTFPLLAPAATIGLTISLIFGLKVFDSILGLTGGGPGTDTETLSTQIYRQAFINGRLGLGAAIAVVLSGLVAVFALTQGTVLRRRERRAA